MTPNILKVAARCIVFLIVLPIIFLNFLDVGGSPTGSAILSYLLACFAMMGYPWARRADIALCVCMLLLALQMVSLAATIGAGWSGVAGGMAGALAAILPSYIRDFRSIAVRNEHLPLTALRAMDRRSRHISTEIMLAKSPSTLLSLVLRALSKTKEPTS